MSTNNDCVLPTLCTPEEVEPKEIYPPATEEFSFCAGNKMITWDGSRLKYTPRKVVIPDGTYGRVTFIDGCITAVGECEYPTYSPPYCNDDPIPCGDDAGTTGITISEAAGNSIKNTSLGLYAKTNISGENGISVRGNGTVRDPYVISPSEDIGGDSSGTIMAGDNSVKVVTENDILKISLPVQAIPAGTYGGLVVNKFGIITDIDDTLVEDAITTIIGTDGVDVATEAGTAKISHSKSPVGNKTYTLGKYRMGLDQGGNVTTMEKVDKPGALVATYQVIVYGPVEGRDGGWTVNSWGDPISNADVTETDSGGSVKLKVPLPEYVSSGDFEVLASTPSAYPWITNVAVSSTGVVNIDYEYTTPRTSVSYINITVREL